MSKKNNMFRGPALWTLLAGAAIGATAMYSAFTGKGISFAFAQNLSPRTAAFTNTESLAALKSLDNAFANLAEYASPAVVLIKAESRGGTSINGTAMMPRGGEGSGFIFRKDGYIITNDHVAGGFDKVTVVLKDGREFPGTVLRSEESDIAVVKINATDLPTLPIGDSSKVKPGQFAVAIGAPFGLENSVSIGHISALGRQNQIGDQMTHAARFYPDMIQTDTPINMGNSGGPLIDVDGEVIGINTAILSPTGISAGVGFAIPSNQARLLAETLVEKGKVTRAYIGLTPDNLKEYQKPKLKVDHGAYVSFVQSDSPAAAAGIKEADVITRVGNVSIVNQMDLRNSMLKYTPGSTVEIELVRDGQTKTVKVKLEEPPKTVAQAPTKSPYEIPFGNSPEGQTPDFKNLPDIKQFFGNGEDENGNKTVPKSGKARLGVSLQDSSDNLRKQFHLPSGIKGAVVIAVEPGSVADKLHMKPGDVIESFDGKPITSAQEFRDAMANVNWGDMKRIRFSHFTENAAMNQDLDVFFK